LSGLICPRHNVSTCPTSTVVGYHGLLKNNPVAEP
jgi:hypothetical protein